MNDIKEATPESNSNLIEHGAFAAGTTFSGIPTSVKQYELANCIEAAQIQWLFVAPEFLEMALETVKSLNMDKSGVMVYDPPDSNFILGPRLASILSFTVTKYSSGHVYYK